MEAIKTSLFRRLFSATSALGIGCLTAHASPAGAETITLLCPLDEPSQPPGFTYTVDLDYVTGTIAIEEKFRGQSRHHFGPSAAVITDRTIKFELVDRSKEPGWPEGTWFSTVEGSLDRLAGTLAITQCAFYNGKQEGCASHQPRCVRATQKF